jgi:hypothetical protein
LKSQRAPNHDFAGLFVFKHLTAFSFRDIRCMRFSRPKRPVSPSTSSPDIREGAPVWPRFVSKTWIPGRARRTEPSALDIDDLQIITAISENVKLLLLYDFIATTDNSCSRASAVSAGPSNT